MPLHLIWLGSEPSQEKLSAAARWETTHGEKVKLWTESDLHELPDGPWRNSSLHPAQRADLLRVSLLKWYGGWYSDLDCIPGTERLPESNFVVLAREDTRQFINCLFYAPKDSLFLKYWAEELLQSLKESHRTSIAESTGPGALTRALHTYALDFGTERISKEIRQLKWSDFRHWPHSVIGMQDTDILPKARLASHIAEASWAAEPHKREVSSQLARWAWKMRHGKFADLSDILRIAVKNPDLAKKCLGSKPLRKAIHHSSLDSINRTLPMAVQPISVNNLSSLKILTRQDSIVIVKPTSLDVAQALAESGWEKISSTPELWIRPRPTSFIPEFGC